MADPLLLGGKIKGKRILFILSLRVHNSVQATLPDDLYPPVQYLATSKTAK